MRIRPVGAELFHADKTYRSTGRHEEATIRFPSFAISPRHKVTKQNYTSDEME